MAPPNPDRPQSTDTKGKKKGKQKKIPEDGAPGPSSAATSSTSSVADSQSGASQQQSTKDKPQKKQEKQSKAKGQSDPGKPAEGKEGATGGGGEGEPPKSKAQLRAERRAVQERQRAMKEAKKAETSTPGGATSSNAGSGSTQTATTSTSTGKKDASAGKRDKAGGDGSKTSTVADSSNRIKVAKTKKSPKVDYQNMSEEQRWLAKEKDILARGCKLDDSIFTLGLQYFHQKIVGADARCVALLTTLRQVIGKYKTPEEKELSRDLEKNFLAPCIKFINDCRPLSTSMGNAIKHLKQQINHIPQGTEDTEAIEMLQTGIDDFINDNILKAAEAVAVYADQKIDHGDVILISAASSLIGHVLKYAHDNGKRFRVVVVEARPRSEGKTMLRYLVSCGISCSYIYIGSACHAMRETTKVFLGAAAMFAIGDMHSRTGNAMIAALAKANNIPVLVCCETYKFTDKVQLSSGVFNQQGRGKDLIAVGHRDPTVPQYESIDLQLLNSLYDVTHSGYITALVTELGTLPCTSVPVVLRRQEDKCL